MIENAQSSARHTFAVSCSCPQCVCWPPDQDVWSLANTSLCCLHYYCLHIVLLLETHITIYHINQTVPLEFCMPLFKSIFKKRKRKCMSTTHKFGIVWPPQNAHGTTYTACLPIMCNALTYLYLLINVFLFIYIFICTHAWHTSTFDCRRIALQKVWCWECVSPCS